MAKIKKKVQKTEYTIKFAEWEYRDIMLLLYTAINPMTPDQKWSEELERGFRAIHRDLERNK